MAAKLSEPILFRRAQSLDELWEMMQQWKLEQENKLGGLCIHSFQVIPEESDEFGTTWVLLATTGRSDTWCSGS